MKSSFSGSLMLLVIITTSGLASVVFKRYEYFHLYDTWSEAQNFCRDRHGDLATIYTHSDVNTMYLNLYEAWIALYKTTVGWQYTQYEGVSHSYNWNNWDKYEPKDGRDCGVVSHPNKMYYSRYCGDYRYFFCKNNAADPNEYSFITEAKTSEQAWEYCKENHLRLAFLGGSDLGSTVTEQDIPVWIGLHRDGGSWNWSSSFSNYRAWKPGEPSNGSDCVSISSTTKEMSTQNCDAHFPLICMWENVFLVKENKSWEEALEHCRGLSSPDGSFRCDLLSLEPGDEHDYVMNKVLEANTEEVWTGLRFLADDWLWVNGADVLYTNLPHCPIPSQHCGALSKKDTGSVEARDCLERKNFLCYTFVP